MTCFCTFWQSAFSVTCFGAFFEVVTCVCINVHGGWCWNEKCLRMVRVVYVSICTPCSQHQEGLRLHVHGEGLLSGSAM